MARALSGAALAARAPLAGAATGASAPTAPATRVAIVDSAKPASGAGAGPLGPIRAGDFAMVGVGDVDWLTAPRFTRLLDNLAVSPGAFRLARLSGVLNSGARDEIQPAGGGIVWSNPSAPMDFSATLAGLAAV